MSAQDTGEVLQGCGQAMQSCGCLLTLFVTIPIIIDLMGAIPP